MRMDRPLLQLFGCLLLLLCFASEPCGAWRRRRRRPPPPPPCTTGQWSSWGACSSKVCGQGKSTRTRESTGSCSGTTSEAKDCDGPCDCKVTKFVPFTKCSVTCGNGTVYQTRQITSKGNSNGLPCPNLIQAVPCVERKCPMPCAVNAYGSWTECSALCGGRGRKYRYSTVSRQPAYGGQACPSLKEERSCAGPCCPVNCILSAWSSYTVCSATCDFGQQSRTRGMVQSPSCNGAACPMPLLESRPCGSRNGGCQQICSNGKCLCNIGFLLQSDGKTCAKLSCGKPVMTSFCPAGQLCKKPLVPCIGYQYLQVCSLYCIPPYVLQGVATLKCLSTGVWADFSTTYCKLPNLAPTKISLSSRTVWEGSPVGTPVGSFVATDPNPSDSHVCLITKPVPSNHFQIIRNTLSTKFVPDFEKQPNSYSIQVKCTDDGGLSTTTSFTVTIKDTNEQPTGCRLSSNQVPENPTLDTLVGSIETSDPDSGQSHTYKLLVSAGGRFKLSGNDIKVDVSNVKCLADGGSFCALDFESVNKYSITVRTTDSGRPALFTDCTLTIYLTDGNDPPRNLALSGYTVKEGMPAGTHIGVLSSTDQDRGQSVVYSLVTTAGGLFRISMNNYLVTTRPLDYDTASKYNVTVRATDNGSPAFSMESNFTIFVLNVIVSVTRRPEGRWAVWGAWNQCSSSCGCGQRFRVRRCTLLVGMVSAERCHGDSVQRRSCRIRSCSGEECPSGWITGCFKCYRVYYHPLRTYHQARSHCSGLLFGSRLLSALSSLHQLDLESFVLSSHIWTWLDVTDAEEEGRWAHSNITTFYSNWRKGSPDGGRQENCAVMTTTDDGRWTDEMCDHQFQTVCERELGAVNGPSPSPWGDWTACSVTCGPGVRVRRRWCSNLSLNHQGAYCPGPSEESEPCTSNTPCPADVRCTLRGTRPSAVCSAEGKRNADVGLVARIKQHVQPNCTAQNGKYIITLRVREELHKHAERCRFLPGVTAPGPAGRYNVAMVLKFENNCPCPVPESGVTYLITARCNPQTGQLESYTLSMFIEQTDRLRGKLLRKCGWRPAG